MNLMGLKLEAKETLQQLMYSLQNLTKDDYTKKISFLGNASIGEHTRHIVELFLQLLYGYYKGEINYDDRKRDKRLEEDIDFAMENIARIISEIDLENKNLYIISLYNNKECGIASTYDRELMYNIEHCIHHQAIIKIGFLLLEKNDLPYEFGFAKSTLRAKQQLNEQI